jgi:hypothetical protein
MVDAAARDFVVGASDLALRASDAKAEGGAIEEPSDIDRATSWLARAEAVVAAATATGLRAGSAAGVGVCGKAIRDTESAAGGVGAGTDTAGFAACCSGWNETAAAGKAGVGTTAEFTIWGTTAGLKEALAICGKLCFTDPAWGTCPALGQAAGGNPLLLAMVALASLGKTDIAGAKAGGAAALPVQVTPTGTNVPQPVSAPLFTASPPGGTGNFACSADASEWDPVAVAQPERNRPAAKASPIKATGAFSGTRRRNRTSWTPANTRCRRMVFNFPRTRQRPTHEKVL